MNYVSCVEYNAAMCLYFKIWKETVIILNMGLFKFSGIMNPAWSFGEGDCVVYIVHSSRSRGRDGMNFERFLRKEVGCISPLF